MTSSKLSLSVGQRQSESTTEAPPETIVRVLDVADPVSTGTIRNRHQEPLEIVDVDE